MLNEMKSEVKTTSRQYQVNLIYRFLGRKGVYNNPISMSCASKYAFDALYELGPNKWHSIDEVADKTIQIMSSISSIDELSQWDAFIARITKNNEEPVKRLKRRLVFKQIRMI